MAFQDLFGLLIMFFLMVQSVAEVANELDEPNVEILSIHQESKNFTHPPLSEQKEEEADKSNQDKGENVKTDTTLTGQAKFGSNQEEDAGNSAKPEEEKEGDKSEESKTGSNTEESEYKAGSICVYCKYCKLCKLCSSKCPCSKGSEHDHCYICKYCDYCHLCQTVCDNVCTPGGILDMFTTAVYEALPSFSDKTKKDIEKDINKAKDFIKEYL